MVGRNGSTTLAPPRLESAYRAGLPVPESPSGSPRRRRWGLTLVGVGAVVLGGWVFARLWLAAGDRVEAVALAEDVEAYEEIERSDLATVRVSEAAGVDVVSAGDIDDLVGRIARADLPADSLLVEADLFAADEVLVGDDEAVVGAELEDGMVPVELARGRQVLVVLRPTASAGSGDEATVETVEGWVLKLEELESTGGRSDGVIVSVVVPRDEASEVAATAADGRLSIVALEE